MRKSKKQKLAEQAERQQRVRDQAKAKRRPSRDDLARVLLWEMITTADRQADANRALGKVCDALLPHLVEQGFDEREAESVFWSLADKYKTGIAPFRIKRHLGV